MFHTRKWPVSGAHEVINPYQRKEIWWLKVCCNISARKSLVSVTFVIEVKRSVLLLFTSHKCSKAGKEIWTWCNHTLLSLDYTLLVKKQTWVIIRGYGMTNYHWICGGLNVVLCRHWQFCLTFALIKELPHQCEVSVRI